MDGDAVQSSRHAPSQCDLADSGTRPDVYRESGTLWTKAQLRTFLELARGHRLSAFFHLAAFTGARRGELPHMRWPDVDLTGKRITTTGSTSVIGGRRVEGTTKSGRSRGVTIDDSTVEVLRAHRVRQCEEADAVGGEWRGEDDGYVFTTAWGDPISPDTVTGLIRTLAKAYNRPNGGPVRSDPLPLARLHGLRHLHATTLLMAGVPVHGVAARLGHADPALTLRVYAHVVRDAETATADVFAQTLKEDD